MTASYEFFSQRNIRPIFIYSRNDLKVSKMNILMFKIQMKTYAQIRNLYNKVMMTWLYKFGEKFCLDTFLKYFYWHTGLCK